jgi:hypothetical protein
MIEDGVSKIIWYEDMPGQGRMETKGGSETIYTLPRAIELSIHKAMKWLVQNPLLLAEAVAMETPTDEEFGKILAKFEFRCRSSLFEPLSHIYGECEWKSYTRYYYGNLIAEIIKKAVIQKLMDLIRAWKSKEVINYLLILNVEGNYSD